MVPAFYVVVGAMKLLYSTVIHIPNMKAEDRTSSVAPTILRTANECVFEVVENRLGICTNVVCQTFKGFFNCIFWNKGKSRYHLNVKVELFVFNVLLLKTICLDFMVNTVLGGKSSP